MKLSWKIISASCIVLLFFLAFLCGMVVYYAANPSTLKTLIENTISHATGHSLTIQEIDYTIDPMKVRAEGIVFGPGKDLKGVCLAVSHVSANIRLDGQFGRKILNISQLNINGFAFLYFLQYYPTECICHSVIFFQRHNTFLFFWLLFSDS